MFINLKGVNRTDYISDINSFDQLNDVPRDKKVRLQLDGKFWFLSLLCFGSFFKDVRAFLQYGNNLLCS